MVLIYKPSQYNDMQDNISYLKSTLKYLQVYLLSRVISLTCVLREAVVVKIEQ